MQILPKFNVVLSNKIEDKSNNKKYNFIKQNEQKDTFTSTTSAVSFKAKPPIPAQLEKMLKSKKYWEVLGATVVATAAALWNQLTNNGENDIDLTEEQIAEMIKANYPDELKNKPEEINTQDENIIEAELVENNDADEKVKLTTMKLEPSKQSAKPVLTEKDLAMVEKIKELYAKGYDVKYMSNELGVSTTKIYNLMNAVGMNPPSKQRLIDAQNLTKEEVVKLYEDNLGKSDKAISCILGISENEMRKIRQKYDIPAPRRITSAKKLEALKKAKEEEKAKKIAKEASEKATIETTQGPKPEVKNEETKTENNKKETVVDTSNVDTQDLNKAVIELTNQNLSTRQIADKLGIKTTDVKAILVEEIKNKSNKLKELADKGYTLEQAAEELGKDIKTIKLDADRKGIIFNVKSEALEEQQANRPENTAETVEETAVATNPKLEQLSKDIVNSVKTLKFIESFFFELYNVRTELKYDKDIEDEIKSIQEKYKKQFELLNKIDTANMEAAVRKFSKKKDNAELTPQGYVRYSTEDFLMRYIASQYRIFTDASNDKEAGIANRKRRGLITEPVLNLKKIDRYEKIDDYFNDTIAEIDKYFDETIPENDPLFEKFVECFDFKSCVMSLKKSKQEFVNQIMKEAKAEELLVKLNNMNAPYVELDIQSLYLILNSTIDYKVPAFPLSIPKFKNGESINDTQKELMQTIEGFKIRKLAKEYVDLVHIYNTYCGQDYDEKLANDLLANLKTIKNPKEISQEELNGIRTDIKLYKLGTIPETRPSETPDDFETYNIRTIEITEDITLEEQIKFFEECQKILEAKFNDEILGEELRDIILDFHSYTETIEDLKNLQKFILILDEIEEVLSNEESDKNTIEASIQNAVQRCNAEGISTKKSKENSILAQIEKIYKYEINNNTSELLSLIQNNINKLSSENLQNLSTDLNKLEKALIDKENIEEQVENIKAKYFSISNISEEQANEYKIALESNIPFEDKYKETIRKKLNKEKSIDINTAIACLAKIDLYQALSDEDKTHITKILTIFNKEAKGLEKRILEAILKNEYIKVPTKINNTVIMGNPVITIGEKAKDYIWDNYKSDRIYLLSAFEDAAKLDYTEGNSGKEGIEYYGKFLRLKLCGKFGDHRLVNSITDKFYFNEHVINDHG